MDRIRRLAADAAGHGVAAAPLGFARADDPVKSEKELQDAALALNAVASKDDQDKKFRELVTRKERANTKAMVKAAAKLHEAAEAGKSPFKFNAAIILANAALVTKEYAAAETFYKFSAELAEKACPCCRGMRVRIGEDVAERLDYRPASLFVRQVVRPTYLCRDCERQGEAHFVLLQCGHLVPGRPSSRFSRFFPCPACYAHTQALRNCKHGADFRVEGLLQ